MQISLKRRAVVSLDLAEDELLRISTTRGSAWVTMENLPEDFILSSRSALKFTGPGRVVIEALDHGMIVRAETVMLPAGEPVLLATG